MSSDEPDEETRFVRSLDGEDWLIQKTIRHGISEHSYFLVDPKAESNFRLEADMSHKTTWAHWEILSNLDVDHAWAVCLDVLTNTVWQSEMGTSLSQEQIEAIADRLGAAQWRVLSDEIEEIEETHNDGRSDYVLTVVWTDLFEETFSEAWLAAQALHALVIGENEFACGYLISELDQKRRNETDVLRGQKVLSGARSAAAERRKAYADMRSKRKSRMEELEPDLGVDNAARQCELEGLGKFDAVKRQWNRNKKIGT